MWLPRTFSTTWRSVFAFAGNATFAATVVAVLLSSPASEQSALAKPGDRRETLGRPIVLTTDADLENARRRIQQADTPFVDVWKKVRLLAEECQTLPPTPYRGSDHEGYFRVGTRDGGRARNLAVAFRLSGNRRFADKAQELLLAWAADEQQYPFSLKSPSHSAGLVVGRVAVLFTDAYALLYDRFGPAERQRIERWFAAMADAIRTSREIWVRGALPKHPPPYLGRQYFNNHLSAHTMGLAAIGFATANEELVAYALTDRRNPRNLRRLIDGAIVGSRRDLYKADPTLTQGAANPKRGEIYDRYRIVQGKGLHYCELQLRLLMVTALMAENNGHAFDFFAYRSRDRQSIKDSLEFYSEFVLSGNKNARTGYYARDKAIGYGFLTLMEVARRLYPQNKRFPLVLQARSRVRYDRETFGWTAPLMYGLGDLPERIGQWEFENTTEMEGWTVRKSLTAEVKDGAMRLQITGRDPAILSPNELDLSAFDFPRLLIRMRNGTEDKKANVFFRTEKHTSFEDSHLYFNVHANDDQYRDYVIDMTKHERWNGRVIQLRIDVLNSATRGEVAVDAIRLLPETASTP
jgi:hypothetical protein